jgi:hypothetical protein
MPLAFDELASKWAEATRRNDHVAAREALTPARRHLANKQQRDLAWFIEALNSGPSERSSYVLAAISQQSPIALLLPLVRANSRCCDPSGLWYLYPAVGAYGSAEVVRALIEVLKTGTVVEQTGAVYGIYWSNGPIGKPSPPVDPVELRRLHAEFNAVAEAILGTATDPRLRSAIQVRLGLLETP